MHSIDILQRLVNMDYYIPHNTVTLLTPPNSTPKWAWWIVTLISPPHDPPKWSLWTLTSHLPHMSTEVVLVDCYTPHVTT